MIKHGKTSKSVFSVLLTTCSLLAGAVPIMAYQQPVLDNSSLYEASDCSSAKSVEIFVPDGAEFPEEYDYLNLPEEPVFLTKETIISSLMMAKSIIFLLIRKLTPPVSIHIKQDIPTSICHTQIKAATTRNFRQSAARNAVMLPAKH